MEDIRTKFVTKEIAEKLINICYDEPCLAQLANDEFIYPKIFRKNIKRLIITHLPLWQDVQDWFAEKHNLFIEVFPYVVTASDSKGHRYSYSIINLNDYSFTIDETILGYLTYNESREQAILKTIELCQSKK